MADAALFPQWGRAARLPGQPCVASAGAEPGSLGPVGFSGEVLADETLQKGQFVAGANRDGWHLRGVEAGRDYAARFADLRASAPTDTCPSCGGALRFSARPSSTRTGARSRS